MRASDSWTERPAADVFEGVCVGEMGASRCGYQKGTQALIAALLVTTRRDIFQEISLMDLAAVLREAGRQLHTELVRRSSGRLCAPSGPRYACVRFRRHAGPTLLLLTIRRIRSRRSDTAYCRRAAICAGAAAAGCPVSSTSLRAAMTGCDTARRTDDVIPT
ncbi:hypothetical protein BV25DRAFT_1831771 [Artomyces pyxidatus]|uniref:Uncharacterized protein n=1 Tax=Artomyces pyxidatus TaxID=48021 RepID=A0ACB8SKC7_9AGAM|nr:hypothetical protein BV25DRAFT_1831771 [Artomyces pyxidatus]